MWIIYEILLFIGLLIYTPKALMRRRLPHRGWTMRLGRYPEAVRAKLARPGALWIHAVSVGEVMAAAPLITRLAQAYPDAPLVLSTVTPTGFEVATQVMGARGAAIFLPFDFRLTVGRAMKAIQPRALLLVESELWPMLIRAAKSRGIPVVVLNGRVSERAHRRYLKVKRWLAACVRIIDACFMQTEQDAQRLIAMGAPRQRVRVLGSLKWDASLAGRPSQAAIQALRERLGIRREELVIVAGSTHRGEESAVVQAVQEIRQRRAGVRLVLAPRHPERAGEVERLASQSGLVTQALTHMPQAGAAPWDVLIIDTLGQLPGFYGLASAVFVGGSLIPHGGQNPLEPASLGKPVIVGPFMDNFSAIMERLRAHQAVRQISTPGELASALREMLTEELEAQQMGRRAQELIEESAGCTQRTVDALAPFLC